MVSDSGGRDPVPVPPDSGDPRRWCAAAAAWLERDRPEAALEAARQAMDRDPRADSGGEWGYRLASLAFERLGRDAEAVAAAEEAVRLAPGSWTARLRLGTALRRVPGRWRESFAQAARAARYAPAEPGPHLLVGDLALLRGEHRRAEAAYRTALGLSEVHPAAEVNLGLALLRWRRPRGHHDPAWPIDPRETARTGRALEVWSRQIRLLLAAALAAVILVAFGTGLTDEARIGGAAVLPAVLAITFRQARRVGLWPYVPRMLLRDPWLGVSVAAAPITVAAYVAVIAALPRDPLPLTFGAAVSHGGGWAVLAGLVLFNGVLLIALRVPVEAWRGRPVMALARFAAARQDGTAERNMSVTLWQVVGRAWSAQAVVAVAARLPGGPGWALAALAVPLALAWARLRGGPARLDRAVAADRWLTSALALLAGTSATLAGVAAVPLLGGASALGEGAWWAGVALLAALVAVFAARSARAWWLGAPGPWRSSLVMSDSRGHGLPGDVQPPVRLGAELRRAFTYSRAVVLAYADPEGPRAMAVGAISSVGPGGELRLVVADEAWKAAEREPRVAVFVADPLDRRFWAEVRGIAVGDGETGLLRITPQRVVVAEHPGPHRGRRQGRHRGRSPVREQGRLRSGRMNPAG
ncbi:hypothetical protein GCM10017673_49660 [Streptosporangium violaceochromogenes]|nr:hypothetical protein GCM10017673_49660 [Streptosporangium violaceochromogenes]